MRFYDRLMASSTVGGPSLADFLRQAGTTEGWRGR
jgi:hypothetical protein